MNIGRYNRAYFIGIGGIGMSALARYFLQKDWLVAGYDKTSTPLTRQLSKEGISIHYEDAIQEIPRDFKDIEKTMVIYTPAVPNDHSELNYFIDNQFDVFKRARAVAEIANNGYCIAVAGTHGKTTTTSLLAHILKNAGKKITAFMGGISTNYNTNLIRGNGKEVVIEADEYDKSFLNLKPNLAILTSMDADHLDIYDGADDLKKNFKAFMALVALDGIKIVNAKLGLEGTTYTIDANTEADYSATEIRIENGTYGLRIKHNQRRTEPIWCGLPGRHNVENAVAAAAAAHQLGLKWPEIKEGIESFQGVKRRFEVHIKNKELVYIDDYAHHPKEIEALIQSVKELYPQKEITTIFQPHLFSRTRDFSNEFADALSLSDNLLLLDIYPAREKPIQGITSEWLLAKTECTSASVVNKEDLIQKVLELKPQVVLTVGAGDIDQCVEPLKSALLKE
jgi:UDP-N-acetylmuramate--alanine ligase